MRGINREEPRRGWRIAAALATTGLAWLVAGCTPQGAADPATTQTPPPEVAVVTVTPAAVGLATELPGRTEASRVAEVRARVAGILQRRVFREGSEVKAGQALFQIDAAPYRATLASAEAALARAEANLLQARAQAERSAPLRAANAISEQDFVNATAAYQQAQAEVAAGKASVDSARINLGYASVTAPISGRIGRALVTEGALVGQGEATQLAIVQQIDPLYVNFTQPAAEVLRMRRAIADGQLRRAGGKDAAEVRVRLDDGSVYPLAGKLLFSDLSVDPTSGQITLRAELPNPDGALLPGLYVRVQLEQAEAPAATLLPQQAVARSPQGDSVRVVDAEGRVATRSVRVGTSRDGHWVVLEGLQAGEQVMVEGFQKLQGDGPVRAVPWQRPGSTTAAPAAATAAESATEPAASAASR